MIRINQLKLNINDNESLLDGKIRKVLKLNNNVDLQYNIVKKSIDARKKDAIFYTYCVNVLLDKKIEDKILKSVNNKDIMLTVDKKYCFPEIKYGREKKIIIVGSGPAGLFCGLFLARAGFCPVIYERGAAVNERTAIVTSFWENGTLNTSTNVQFGEGGAGTFSDGKLNTAIKEKSGRIHKVLETFVEFGAPAEILYLNKPHIGTDILKNVVMNIRNEIIRLGGMVNFNSQITDIGIKKGRVCSVTVNNSEQVECDRLVLALGHSARDTFRLLLDKGLAMEQKSFAVGLRLEHPQSLINEYAYKDAAGLNRLPAADYKVTAKAANGRGVYSFCMCPGGYVVNASSEDEHLCVNGMSYSKRDGHNSNSAIIVTVSPQDFGSDDILDGMRFQQKLEKAAYIEGCGSVPYQLNEDFALGRKSTGFGSVTPCILGKHVPGDLNNVLPEFIAASIKECMKTFGGQIQGFNRHDAVFSGIESRTSSPVRMTRDDTMQSTSILGIYPCGEGAGYAGGITSAAVDGIKTAEAIASFL